MLGPTPRVLGIGPKVVGVTLSMVGIGFSIDCGGLAFGSGVQSCVYLLDRLGRNIQCTHVCPLGPCCFPACTQWLCSEEPYMGHSCKWCMA